VASISIFSSLSIAPKKKFQKNFPKKFSAKNNQKKFFAETFVFTTGENSGTLVFITAWW
jgi:hypothetical protein